MTPSSKRISQTWPHSLWQQWQQKLLPVWYMWSISAANAATDCVNERKVKNGRGNAKCRGRRPMASYIMIVSVRCDPKEKLCNAVSSLSIKAQQLTIVNMLHQFVSKCFIVFLWQKEKGLEPAEFWEKLQQQQQQWLCKVLSIPEDVGASLTRAFSHTSLHILTHLKKKHQ